MEPNYLDIESLTAPISEGQPCGEDLEYSPMTIELERLIQGDERNRILLVDGEARTADTDWKEVRSLSLKLFEETKDLRVGVILTKALTHLHGFQGLRNGMLLLAQLLEQYWKSLYPLDPEDEEWTSTARTNALEGLLNQGSLREFLWHEIPLVSSRSLGNVRLVDLAPTPSAGDEHDPVLASNILDEEPFQVTEQIDVSIDIEKLCRQIAEILEQQFCKAPQSLVEIEEMVRNIAQHLAPYNKAVDSPEPPPIIETPPALNPPPKTRDHGLIDLEITSRDDVRLLVDKLCRFYEESEPSSPVPVLLRKAEEMIGKSFEDVLIELQPEGTSLTIKLDGAASRGDEGGSL